MALKITKANDLIKVENLVITIYGNPGCGKSTLGFSANKPLMLDFDKGSHRAMGRKDTVVIESWKDVEGMTAEDLAGYDTIVVDTAGRCLDSMAFEIIRKNPKMGNGSGGLSLQGFGALKGQFSQWLKLLRSMGKDVVLIAHSDEQRDGDTLIERLDMQGASKNEVYKSADAMGRIFMQGEKRVLNFSPSGTQFGKNPGNLPPLEVPNADLTPDFLATVIQQIKDKLNELSEEQVAEQARLDELRERIGAFESVDDFNAEVTAMADASDKDKGILLKLGTERGYTFDRKDRRFVAPEEEPAEEADVA
jgi:hypothetical protein